MSDLSAAYRLILEMDQLKLVFRNTMTAPERKESTAEHSWSAAMITIISMQQLKLEFPNIDELKTVKLALIHDTVEIYAGDVFAFDKEGRKQKEMIEQQALEKLEAIYPSFGKELHDLWYEFEEKCSIEAQVAKAADAICPLFQRLSAKQSYTPFNITIANLEETKYPHFAFSKTFCAMYEKLKNDLIAAGLIEDRQLKTAQ